MRPEPDIGIDRAIRLVDRTRRAARIRTVVEIGHYLLLVLAVALAAGKAWGIFA